MQSIQNRNDYFVLSLHRKLWIVKVVIMMLMENGSVRSVKAIVVIGCDGLDWYSFPVILIHWTLQ